MPVTTPFARIVRGFVALVLLLAGIAAGLSPHPASAQDVPGYEPRFEPGDCRFNVPAGYAVECGDLVVPEDRRQPDGAWIRLHVAIFKSHSPTPAPDPVIYLAGGGGYNQLDAVAYYLGDGSADTILATRDYIHYNQRGAEYSDPVVDCPGHLDVLNAMAGEHLTQAEHNAREIAALLACRDTLTAQGINLDMYNSAANAADAHDLRVALGYEQANYYGTSYGTRLALTLLRDYPDGVRSVILDSVYPPQVDYYSELAPNVARAFELVFSTCAADSRCHAAYPDIDATFYALIDRLDAEPAARTINGRRMLITGSRLIEAMELMLYERESIGALPWLVTQADRGHFEPLDQLFDALLTSIPADINWAMFYAMQCREEVPFEAWDTAQALAAAAQPQIADFMSVRWAGMVFDLCAQWGATPADALENEPVVSAVPTLVLAGGFDPATPPAWSQLAAATLSNSFYVEFPTLSHGVMRSHRCGMAIGLQFLDDPTTMPDTSCVASIGSPRFIE